MRFDEAYQAHAQALFRYAFLKVSDMELARDITADTFVRFWKALASGKEVKNAKALLYFIIHGLVVDHYRHGESKKKVHVDDIDEEYLSFEPDMAAAVDDRQALRRIYTKLKALKKEYEEVIVLHFVEDLSISEIAEVLGKKENAVRVSLHRAMKELKGQYGRQ